MGASRAHRHPDGASASWHARILARLGRITSGGGFIPEIDGLRFFSIATVILVHCRTQTATMVMPVATGGAAESFRDADHGDLFFRIAQRGDVGVLVFFAISGFILALPFARHLRGGADPVRLRPYFLKRLTRLEPPYVLSLLAFFALEQAFPPKGIAPGIGDLAAGLGYVNNLVFGTYSKINPPAWSLEIEVQFYVLAPALALVFAVDRPWLRRGLVAAAAAGSAALWAFADIPLKEMHLYHSIIAYLWCFLAGFLLVDAYLDPSSPLRGGRGIRFDALGLAGIALLLLPVSLPRWCEPCAFLVGCPLLFLGAFRGSLLNRAFTNPWIVTVGGMCYSIYLLHYAVIFVAVRSVGTRLALDAPAGMNLLVQLAVCLPPLLAASALYFAFIERPCMRRDWPERAWAALTRGRRAGR